MRVVDVLPFLVNVLLVEVVGFGRDEGRLNSSVFQVIPGEVFEPRMVLHFVGAVHAKSVAGFALNEFIYKIGSLEGPASGDFVFLNLHLFRQNVVSNFLASFSDVGSAAEHALKSNHSESKVVRFDSVVLAAHNFRGHIAWRARCVLRVVCSPNPCYSIVCNSQVAYQEK